MMARQKTYWSRDREACLAAVQQAYKEEGRIGQTVRHYYYKLLSAGAIRLLPVPNSAGNAYSFVSNLLTDARHEGELPWPAVVDPGRRSFPYRSYESIAHYIRAEARSGYQADIWRGQPRRLEVWVEKDGIADFVKSVVGAYRVPVHVTKGYASATVIKDAAERYGTGRGWTLLYAGDFDPSGLDIERNLREALKKHHARPEIHRVALIRDDTALFSAQAALDLKAKDTRYKQFVAKYGAAQKGYELEALPASQLRQKLLEALEVYMDCDEIARVAELEQAVRDKAEAALRDALSGVGEDILLHGLPDTSLDMATIRRYLDAEQAA